MSFFGKADDISHPYLRDYTEATEGILEKIADEAINSDNSVSGWLESKVGRWLEREGLLHIFHRGRDYTEKVIDYYDYSARIIHEICTEARAQDRLYGSRIASCVAQADRCNLIIRRLSECLNPKSAEFDPSMPFPQRLLELPIQWAVDQNGRGKRISDLANDANRFANHRIPHGPSDQDIIDFCHQEEADTVFSDYSDSILKDAMKSDFWRDIVITGGTILYKGVEITWDELLAMFGGKHYMEKVTREMLSDLIDNTINAQNASQAYVKDHDVAKETMDKLLDDYGKMSDEEKKNSAIGQFIEAMGGSAAAKKILEECPELLDYWFQDYQKGLEILDDIAETADGSGSKEMQRAIRQLREDYQNKWIGTLRKIRDADLELLRDLSGKQLRDWIEEHFPGLQFLTFAADAADVETQTDTHYKLLALEKIEADLERSYREAIESVRAGNTAEENCARVRNLFDMLKECNISICSTYRDACADDPDKQIELNNEISRLKDMTMGNFQAYQYHP